MVEVANEEKLEGNKMKVSAKGNVRAYIKYASEALTTHDSVDVSAAGNAIAKALVFIELIKRESEFELHQTSSVKTIQVEEKQDKKIEGLEEVKKMRTVTLMNFRLFKSAPEEKGIGYQEPISKEEKENHK
jgi:DNA transposition AAA+ family ATPase